MGLDAVRAGKLARQLLVVALMAAVGTPAAQGAAAADAPGNAPAIAGIRLAQAELPPPPPPRPKPTPKGSIETSGVRLTAVIAEGSPPLEDGIEWQVTTFAGGGEPVASSDPVAEIELLPGRYRARALGRHVEGEAVFSVNWDKVTAVAVPLAAGALEAVVVAAAATMPLDLATFRVRRAGDSGGEPLVTATGGRLDAVLPPGSYEVEAGVGLVSAREVVEVTEGATARAEIMLEVGFVVAEALAAEGTEPLSGATFSIYRGSGPEGAIELARATGRRAIFSVAPGEYRLEGRYGLASVEELVRVGANDLSQVRMTLDAALVEVDAIGPDIRSGPNVPARFRVVRVGAGGGEALLAEFEGSSPTLRLPAGDFRLEAERDGASADGRVELSPGERTRFSLVLGGGELRIRSSAAPGLIGNAEVELSALPVIDGTADIGRRIVLGRLSENPVRLPAGDYLIEGRLVPGGAVARVRTTVGEETAGEVSLAFDVGAARLEVRGEADGEALADARWILRPDGEAPPIRVSGSVAELALAPGAYRVVVDAGGQRAEGEITIEAGARVELSLIAE